MNDFGFFRCVGVKYVCMLVHYNIPTFVIITIILVLLRLLLLLLLLFSTFLSRTLHFFVLAALASTNTHCIFLRNILFSDSSCFNLNIFDTSTGYRINEIDRLDVHHTEPTTIHSKCSYSYLLVIPTKPPNGRKVIGMSNAKINTIT